MSRNLAPVVKVASKNGFMANQRVVGQDVEPPRTPHQRSERQHAGPDAAGHVLP